MPKKFHISLIFTFPQVSETGELQRGEFDIFCEESEERFSQNPINEEVNLYYVRYILSVPIFLKMKLEVFAQIQKITGS